MIKTGLMATGISLIITCGIAYWAMNAMPTSGEIPVHWNFKGEADGFASPEEARKIVWLLPAISAGISLLFAVGSKIDPRNKNIRKSSRAYLAGWISLLVIMTLITGLVAYSMVNGASMPADMMSNTIPSLIVGSLSLLFIVLGNYLPKTRSNWFFGIRTPWTLSSEEAWERTNRIAGRLFLLLGAAGLLSVFFLPPEWQYGIIVGGSLFIAGFSLLYSFLVWRKASDQQTTPDYVE